MTSILKSMPNAPTASTWSLGPKGEPEMKLTRKQTRSILRHGNGICKVWKYYMQALKDEGHGRPVNYRTPEKVISVTQTLSCLFGNSHWYFLSWALCYIEGYARSEFSSAVFEVLGTESLHRMLEKSTTDSSITSERAARLWLERQRP